MKLIYYKQFIKRRAVLILSVFGLLFFFLFNSEDRAIQQLRKSHLTYLQNSPFKKSLALSKHQRKAQGLPPNKYYEREWELTMDPRTGKPAPEKVLALQNKIQQRRAKPNVMRRSPGDALDNLWIERGPDTIGGRTRAVLFDPNDASNKRVFAGGVSGGLWVNDDITDSKFSWERVTGVPGNMAVSCITVDPNNPMTMYLGTGEMYTGGAVTGNGVYKSTDGGLNWTHVLAEEANSQINDPLSSLQVPGKYFIQDIIAWNNNSGNTEIFIAVGVSYIWSYRTGITTYLGETNNEKYYGVYRSQDDGDNWTKLNILNKIPNDFEISEDNTLWLTTTNYIGSSDLGGTILYTTDGENFQEKKTIPNLLRTELAVSEADANKMYVLAETTSNKPIIYKTTDGFENFTEMTLPEDADSGIPANDFTRSQAFYNLMIEVDPTDDNTLYVGGINLFRSTDGASSWEQISKWNSGINGGFSVVHADQHAMAFRPESANQAVFGNDGGVYYSDNLSSAENSSTAITSRNKGYITTQFYRAAISPQSEEDSSYYLGGTQDNGTQLLAPFFGLTSRYISGGDGGYCFIDQDQERYLITSYVYNYNTLIYFRDNNGYLIYKAIISEDESGDFITQAALDSNLDILYTNASLTNDNRIYRFSNLISFISGETSVTSDTLRNTLLDRPTALKVSPYTISSTTLLVGTQTGKLLKVNNANTANPSWSNIGSQSFLGSISDIEYGATKNEIYVTFHNYGLEGSYSNIWYSDNGGTTWQAKEGDLPDLPVKCILHNPLVLNEVIIGTELGVWKTTNFNNSSPTWEQTYNGMSDVKITDMQYRADGHTVLVATFGRGLFSGAFSATPAKIISQDIATPSLILSSNISSGMFEIIANKSFTNISVFVYSIEGRQVFKTSRKILDKDSPLEMNLQVSKGIYIVNIFSENQLLKQQQIIVK